MIKILITQEGEPTLITPCLCCGSLKFVHQVLLQSLTSNHPCLQRLLVFISSLSSTPHPRHQECLQRWIKSSDIKRCELCKFPFVMQSKVNHHHHFQMMIKTMIRSHRGEKSFQYPAIIKVSMPRLEMGTDLSAQLAGHENVFVRQFRNIILQLEGSEVKILAVVQMCVLRLHCTRRTRYTLQLLAIHQRGKVQNMQTYFSEKTHQRIIQYTHHHHHCHHGQVKPLVQWEKLDMSSLERRKLCCSVTFHAVSIITAIMWSWWQMWRCGDVEHHDHDHDG